MLSGPRAVHGCFSPRRAVCPAVSLPAQRSPLFTPNSAALGAHAPPPFHPLPPRSAFSCNSGLATHPILPAKLQQRCVPGSIHERHMNRHLRRGQASSVG